MAARKITRLEAQQKNPDRVSVFLDRTFAFGVHQDLVLEYGLHVGRMLDEAEQRELESKDEVLRAKSIALNYLAYKPRTEREIRTKLARGGFSEEVADAVVQRLYALHFLDDAAYAHTFVTGRFRNRGYGPARIRGDLVKRGVDRHLIDEAIEGGLNPDETREVARAQAEKRWERLTSEPDVLKRRKKLSDFLLRRGFSYDTVREVVEAVSRE
ncbi:MAG TPA: RecX family transcriptional regulator [Rhodothermales bacterium]|nr:RecX family transcriptional regulator [Rhodothermales bacterium]